MRGMRTAALVLLLLTAAVVAASGQQPPPTPQPGPVVPGFGRTFDVPEAALVPPKDHDLKVRFDVKEGAEPGAVNIQFDSVARFLNMHARSGAPRERAHAALVVHGTAGKDLLTNDEYRKRYGQDNPNLKLLDELKAAGVRIYLCGQTSKGRNLPRASVSPAVDIALSAMVAHLVLDQDGYVLNPF